MKQNSQTYKLKRWVVGTLQTNCYLLWDLESLEALLIDPGANPEWLLAEIRRRHLNLRFIVNTHGHADHIGGNFEINKATGAKIYLHKADLDILLDPTLNLSQVLTQPVLSPAPDAYLEDGMYLLVGKHKLQVIATPGHTPGSICLLADGVLFSGDTLFAGSIGRTDFPYGDAQLLLHSIRSRLVTLPGKTLVYPGHGPKTDIGQEKQYNPFLYTSVNR